MITLNLLPDVKIEYLRTRQVKAKVISIATLIALSLHQRDDRHKSNETQEDAR